MKISSSHRHADIQTPYMTDRLQSVLMSEVEGTCHWPYFEPSFSFNHSFHLSMPLVIFRPHLFLVPLYLCKQATNQKIWVMQNTWADSLCPVNCAGWGGHMNRYVLLYATLTQVSLATIICLLNKHYWDWQCEYWAIPACLTLYCENATYALYCPIVCWTLWPSFIQSFSFSDHRTFCARTYSIYTYIQWIAALNLLYNKFIQMSTVVFVLLSGTNLFPLFRICG